ncbi:MAG: restriction endonuclease [Candidatus Velthaea sp.]
MPPNSQYDQLHDHYHQIRTTKSGTRYEILAAVVFAAYEQDAVVIHDLRLIGDDSHVPHQIDVVVERAGKPFRVLIECKDYDISGDDVGLAIVRDFYGVFDDIHPDAAWIITCNGFTADARAYAKAKGIRLATLRLFQDADWSNGRINTIGVDFTFITPDPGMILTLRTVNDAARAPILAGLPPSISLDQVDHTELHDGQRTRSIADILRSLSRQPVVAGSTRHVESRADLEGAWFSPNGGERYPITAYEVGYPLRIYRADMRIGAVRSAARLLLLDDDGLDFVVWEDTLSAYSITAEGRVIAPPPAVQQRVQTTMTSKL